jgi:hypothetical protein
MPYIRYVGQLIQWLNRSLFKNIKKEYGAHKHQKRVDTWSPLTSMLFCHLARSQSLRDLGND